MPELKTDGHTWQQNRDNASADICPNCHTKGTIEYWRPDKYVQRKLNHEEEGHGMHKVIPPQCSKCGYKLRRRGENVKGQP